MYTDLGVCNKYVYVCVDTYVHNVYTYVHKHRGTADSSIRSGLNNYKKLFGYVIEQL